MGEVATIFKREITAGGKMWSAQTAADAAATGTAATRAVLAEGSQAWVGSSSDVVEGSRALVGWPSLAAPQIRGSRVAARDQEATECVMDETHYYLCTWRDDGGPRVAIIHQPRKEVEAREQKQKRRQVEDKIEVLTMCGEPIGG